MIQVAISPNTLLEELLQKNELDALSSEEADELDSINELERFFTYLNAQLIAPA